MSSDEKWIPRDDEERVISIPDLVLVIRCFLPAERAAADSCVLSRSCKVVRLKPSYCLYVIGQSRSNEVENEALRERSWELEQPL